MPPEKSKYISSVQSAYIPKGVQSGLVRNGHAQTGDDRSVSRAAAIGNSKTIKSKLNLKSLEGKGIQCEKNFPIESSKRRKLRAVVDIEVMKEELKQLEDLPVTLEEKRLSSARLGFDFFNVPCEVLARNLLGKILVRRLENGTLLKGKIVETESYLGGEDKASQTYQNKITPRNAPMYMPPGTIYVYLTYGMYHCFNISSQGQGACIFIRALEPILGLSTMELLRNMKLKKGTKYKEVSKKITHFKSYQLCNGPSKFCTALDIDTETFNKKDITQCPDLWIEANRQELDGRLNIVAAPRIGIDSAGPQWAGKSLRYYIFENTSVSQRNFACDGAAVLIRALAPLEGLTEMASLRNSSFTSKSKKSFKTFKPRELCGGPSKFCMAFGLSRDHSKYSLCTWRGLWLENNVDEESIRIIKSPRIGIDSAGPEWAQKPLRLYIYGEESVSKRDKKAEAAS